MAAPDPTVATAPFGRVSQGVDMRLTRIGIATFAFAVLAGPLYTVQGYSSVGNLISELAAQNTPGNFLMAGAFVILGAAIVADGVRVFHRAFVAFGFFMALAGLFGIAMLVLPGQGIITILFGLSIVDLRIKRRVLRWLLERPAIEKSVQRLREKAGQPPLVIPPAHPAHG